MDASTNANLPTTGKHSLKPYRCTRCNYESMIGTNHWGECYPRCSNCAWKNPLDPTSVHVCLEPVPEGYGVPEPWTKVKLGDICEIQRGVPINE